jgi:hypothetical protein
MHRALGSICNTTKKKVVNTLRRAVVILLLFPKLSLKENNWRASALSKNKSKPKGPTEKTWFVVCALFH